MFESRVLRRTVTCKRDEVAGHRTKLSNEELHNLYSAAHINRASKSHDEMGM